MTAFNRGSMRSRTAPTVDLSKALKSRLRPDVPAMVEELRKIAARRKPFLELEKSESPDVAQPVAASAALPPLPALDPANGVTEGVLQNLRRERTVGLIKDAPRIDPRPDWMKR